MTLEHPKDTVIYRSRLHPKINRNFPIFDPVDFLAILSQPIPDKGRQTIRYYGLYSDKARGIRRKKETSPSIAWPYSAPPPPLKLPKRTWRDLICQAWPSDPLPCPKGQNEMRLMTLIEEPLVIEKSPAAPEPLVSPKKSPKPDHPTAIWGPTPTPSTTNF